MKKNDSHAGFWGTMKRPFTGLAPMDGVTDAPFRFMAAKYGKPDVIFTEFTPVEGIAAGAVRTMYSLIYGASERPIVAQFFGKVPLNFYMGAMIAAELGFDGIDINMGCPAKNIAGKGCGAGLILDPPLAKKIILAAKKGAKDWAEGKKLSETGLPEPILEYIRSAKKSWAKSAGGGTAPSLKPVRSRKPARKILPVSVKTRLGYEKNTATEWVKHLLEAAPSAITLHGRTFRQSYGGEADWNAIGRAADLMRKAGAVAIGNGDVKSLEDARLKAVDYGVDGVLIGRAALGNPWIFSKKTPSEKTPTVAQKFKVAAEHAKKYTQIFGRGYFSPMKKHLAWYCRGFPGAAAVRQALMTADSFEEVENILKKALTRA